MRAMILRAGSLPADLEEILPQLQQDLQDSLQHLMQNDDSCDVCGGLCRCLSITRLTSEQRLLPSTSTSPTDGAGIYDEMYEFALQLKTSGDAILLQAGNRLEKRIMRFFGNDPSESVKGTPPPKDFVQELKAALNLAKTVQAAAIEGAKYMYVGAVTAGNTVIKHIKDVLAFHKELRGFVLLEVNSTLLLPSDLVKMAEEEGPRSLTERMHQASWKVLLNELKSRGYQIKLEGPEAFLVKGDRTHTLHNYPPGFIDLVQKIFGDAPVSEPVRSGGGTGSAPAITTPTTAPLASQT